MRIAILFTVANFESAMSQVQATIEITKDSMSKTNGQTVNTIDTPYDLTKQMGNHGVLLDRMRRAAQLSHLCQI